MRCRTAVLSAWERTVSNPGSPELDGCVDWMPPEGCYSPCGGERDVSEDASCLDVAGTETGTGSESGTVSGTMTVEPSTESESSGGSETSVATGTETGPFARVISDYRVGSGRVSTNRFAPRAVRTVQATHGKST